MDPNNPNSSPGSSPVAPPTPGSTPSDLTPPAPPSLSAQTPPPANPYDPPPPPLDQPPQPGAISSPTPTPNPWDIPLNPPAEASAADTFTPPSPEPTPAVSAPPPLTPQPQENSWIPPQPPTPQEQLPQTPPLADQILSAAPPAEPVPQSPTPPSNPVPVFDQTAADPANTLSDLGIGGGAPEAAPLPDPLHSEPSEPAPTDLSQLSGLGSPPETQATPQAPSPTPTETVTIPPSVETSSPGHEKTHKLPKVLLFGGIAVILLVVLLSVYLFFIRGSSTPAPSSLPAQTTSEQLPLTSPPTPIQPAVQPPVATGAANTAGFGSFSTNDSSASGTTHQSAFDIAKAREAQSTASGTTTP